jgi:hypothetical protein
MMLGIGFTHHKAGDGIAAAHDNLNILDVRAAPLAAAATPLRQRASFAAP